MSELKTWAKSFKAAPSGRLLDELRETVTSLNDVSSSARQTLAQIITYTTLESAQSLGAAAAKTLEVLRLPSSAVSAIVAKTGLASSEKTTPRTAALRIQLSCALLASARPSQQSTKEENEPLIPVFAALVSPVCVVAA